MVSSARMAVQCPGLLRHPMHRLATMPRRDAVPAVAFPVRGAAPHGAVRGDWPGATRRAAGGTHSRAMPDDERWREARRTRAMAGGDRQGAAAPSRSGRRCDRRPPQWRLRLCTTRTGLRGPWAWRPPSRARQMANAVSGVVRQRTGSPARRQHGSKVTRDR